MAKRLRTFVALPLPQTIVRHLSTIQNELRGKGLKIGWVRPANIHLTIKFIGDIAPEDVAAVTAALESSAHAIPPMELTVQGMGLFPNAKRPRVLWAGLGGATEALKQFAVKVDAALEPLGIKCEKRPFKAHLTLGRIRKPIDARWLLDLVSRAGRYAPQQFTADQVIFYKSDLRPTGAVYSALAHIALKR